MTEALLKESPLSSDELAEWQAISDASSVNSDGPPSAEEMAARSELKRRKQAFLASLDEPKKGFIKKLEAAAKKEQQSKKKAGGTAKADDTAVGVATATASAAAAASAGGNDTAPKKEKEKEKKPQQQKQQQQQQQTKSKKSNDNSKKEKLASDRKLKKSFKALCDWLQISLEYSEMDNEAVFEIQLPKWLIDRSDFLERTDLDEGKVMLDGEEMEDILTEGMIELAMSYFGEDFVNDFDFENLCERAQAKEVLAQKKGLPPWYKHMSFPMTPEEVELSAASSSID